MRSRAAMPRAWAKPPRSPRRPSPNASGGAPSTARSRRTWSRSKADRGRNNYGPDPELFLLEVRGVDGDARAALEARDVGLVIGGALHAGGARFELLVAGRGRLAFDHLGDAHDQVAGLRDRHAEVGRELRGVGRDHLAKHFALQALRGAA